MIDANVGRKWGFPLNSPEVIWPKRKCLEIGQIGVKLAAAVQNVMQYFYWLT